MIDTGPLLRKVAELAEYLDEEYGPQARLTAGIVVVEVETRAGDDDTPIVVEHRATTTSAAHAVGLLEIASHNLRTPFESDDEEDD